MGYLHINNLYKEQDILAFRECYALEKIHGTSAHIGLQVVQNWTEMPVPPQPPTLLFTYFPGGVKQSAFEALFDKPALEAKLLEIGDITVYGEAYGGSCQKGMSIVYGPQLRFVVFDVQINDTWLAVPDAAEVAASLGLDFVDFVRIPATIEAIDFERDRPSVQAVKNGMGGGLRREGVILRPLREYTTSNDRRVIVKHKQKWASETETVKKVQDPAKLAVLEDAQAIAREWVTPNRVEHVLDKISEPGMEKMQEIMKAMQEDIKREAEGEIVWSPEVSKQIGRQTATLVRLHFETLLHKG